VAETVFVYECNIHTSQLYPAYASLKTTSVDFAQLSVKLFSSVDDRMAW